MTKLIFPQDECLFQQPMDLMANSRWQTRGHNRGLLACPPSMLQRLYQGMSVVQKSGTMYTCRSGRFCTSRQPFGKPLKFPSLQSYDFDCCRCPNMFWIVYLLASDRMRRGLRLGCLTPDDMMSHCTPVLRPIRSIKNLPFLCLFG